MKTRLFHTLIRFLRLAIVKGVESVIISEKQNKIKTKQNKTKQ